MEQVETPIQFTTFHKSSKEAITINQTQSNADKKMLIVSEQAYTVLVEYARSNRLKPDPSQILPKLLQENGIYFAAFIADRPEKVKHLRIPETTFKQLQHVQLEMNVDGRNFSLLDIVTAQMVILFGTGVLEISGEMVAIAEGKQGVSTVTRDDALQHLNSQNQLEWKHPTRIIASRKHIEFDNEIDFSDTAEFDAIEEEWERNYL